jgi:fructokinase
LTSAALDDEGGVVVRRRQPMPQDDYEGTVAAVPTLVDQIESDYETRATVGVGIPGVISPATGLVKNSNSTCLIEKPFDQDLSTARGCTIRVANDANCFGLSEAVDGAAADAGVVFGVILGTGVGGGVVIDCRQLISGHAIAGKWGDNPMPGLLDEDWTDRPCYCGQTAYIETFLSGPAISVDHERRTGEHLDAATTAERASAGNEHTQASIGVLRLEASASPRDRDQRAGPGRDGTGVPRATCVLRRGDNADRAGEVRRVQWRARGGLALAT